MIPSARYLALLIPVLALIASLACSDDAEHDDKWPEVPEVVEVTFSGIAGEEGSKFIVRFDEPVTIVKGTQSGMVEKEVIKEVEKVVEVVIVEKEVIKEVEIPGETVVVEREVVEVVPYTGSSSSESLSGSGVLLDVRYPGGGSDRHISIQTEASPDKPIAELSFGPVESEFAVAYRIPAGRGCGDNGFRWQSCDD